MIRENSEKRRLVRRSAFLAFSLALLFSSFSLSAFGPFGLLFPLMVSGGVWRTLQKTAPLGILVAASVAGCLTALLPYSLDSASDARFQAAVAAALERSETIELSGTVSRSFDSSFVLETSVAGITGDVLVKPPSGIRTTVGDSVSAVFSRMKKPPSSEFERSFAKRGAVTFLDVRTVSNVSVAASWEKTVRGAVSEALKRLFPRKESSLARGMILGDGDGIEKEAIAEYRKSGLSHLVVASGGNIAVVVGMLFFFVKRIPSRYSIPLLLSAIWGYAALSGFGIPVVRAAVMASVATALRPLGRLDSTNLLLATAAAFLTFDPDLASDASFLLSFSATLGLCLFSEPIEAKLEKVPSFLGLRSSVAATLATWITTAPVSMGAFGTVSTVSIMANIAVAPFVLPSIFSPLLAIFPEVLGFSTISTLVAFPGYLSLRLVNFVAETSSVWTYSFISNIPDVLAWTVVAASAVFVSFLLVANHAYSMGSNFNSESLVRSSERR